MEFAIDAGDFDGRVQHVQILVKIKTARFAFNPVTAYDRSRPGNHGLPVQSPFMP
jgi:hypothetical protein